MANEKKSEGGQFAGKPEDAANLISAVEIGQAVRRIKELEDSVKQLEHNQLDRHAKLITIIFSCITAFVAVCAILVTILGILSKSETNEATKEMKSDVKQQMQDFERRFQLLAGESLKKPLIEISCGEGLLDGREFEIRAGSPPPFYPLFLKNIGDKKTEPFSIRLFVSSGIGLNPGLEWEPLPSNDKEYPICYYSGTAQNSRTAGIGISPKEPWTMPAEMGMNLFPQSTNVVKCKLQVFYGAESPAEAKFVIKFKP